MSLVKDKQSWFQAFAIFLVALLQYANTANHDYAWDDAIVITQNSRVQKGLSDIPELFENIKSEKTENRYGYRPIALLSFATDIELFGLDPKAAHKVNILLYGLLCLVLFLFLRNMFQDRASLAVFAVMLIFVTHPLHTEVVANIKSRDEILALMFGIGGLYCLRQAMHTGKWYQYLLMVLFLVLSFNSKESGITFCGVALLMPLYSNLDLRKNLKPLLMGILVSGAALTLLLLIRQYVYSERFFQTNDWDLIYKGIFVQDGFSGNPLWDETLIGRIPTAIYLIFYGVFRFIAPLPLAHDYSYKMFEVRTWSDIEVYGALLMVMLIVGLTIHGLIKRKPHGFGLAFYLITNSIYLHLAHVGPDIFAERYLFVPSLGICIALLSFFPAEKQYSKHLVWLPVLVALPFFSFSWDRNPAWKNNNVLLKTDLERLSNCSRTNYNYAIFLHERYYSLPPDLQPAAAEEILSYYEKSLAITKRIFKVYMDLGAACMEFGKPKRAFEVFSEAAKEYPELSGPYVQLGKFYMSFSEFAKAIPYFDKAIEKGSANSDYYYMKALCLVKTGRADEALPVLDEGEKLGATAVNYYVLLATLYKNNGDLERMREAINKGAQQFPNSNELRGLESELRNLTNSS